jgi:ABC-2 type transport system ATP-binding protein
MTDVILQAEHLAKTFRVGFWGKPVEALRDVSFELRAGESLGYLGPNGSGKTTSIKCALTLIRPTAGRLRLFGQDPSSPVARARVGYLPEAPYFYDWLTPTEVLDYVGHLYGLDGATRRTRSQALLERLGLGHAAKRPLRGFSKGMLQRVGIAQSLLADPDLLIWDEPMSGLDPVGRKEVRELMAELRREGKSLFFSSHVLADVETLCDAVVILDRGKAVAQGRLRDLLNTDQLETEVLLALPADREAGESQASARAQLSAVAGVRWLEQGGDEVRLVLPTAQVPALQAVVVATGAVVRELHARRDTLEELFVRNAVHVGDRAP